MVNYFEHVCTMEDQVQEMGENWCLSRQTSPFFVVQDIPVFFNVMTSLFWLGRLIQKLGQNGPIHFFRLLKEIDNKIRHTFHSKH